MNPNGLGMAFIKIINCLNYCPFKFRSLIVLILSKSLEFIIISIRNVSSTITISFSPSLHTIRSGLPTLGGAIWVFEPFYWVWPNCRSFKCHLECDQIWVVAYKMEPKCFSRWNFTSWKNGAWKFEHQKHYS